jgi:tetratricopeptide (TPR) repeat protein
LTALVLSPWVAFGLLEAGLRVAGLGYPTSFFLPRKVNGQEVVVQNNRFGWRFFGPELARSPYPLVMPAVKAPGTCRVFVFGESAAYGDPQPEFGLARMLAVLLRARQPGVRFEVVNVAMTAINSHAILPIAQDCARQHGDVWVIYMGNNEVIGPFGAGTVFGPQAASRALIRSSLAVKSTRTGQLIERGIAGAQGRLRHRGEWGGLMMFLKHRVRPEDPRLAAVYASFERNLDDILQTAIRHQARVVVSTVAGNLRDCAPFASLHPPDWTDPQAAAWDRLFQAGVEAQTAGRASEAAAWFRQAGEIDRRFAELQFRWGRACLALGQDAAARQHLTLAREEDALRFRPDTRINEIIRRAASGRESNGVFLADGEAAFTGQSPQGLIGNELLYEHVHLTFEGNYLLARTLAEQVGRALPPELAGRADASRPWLSLAECAARLGWTDWHRHRGAAAMLARLSDPPFATQANHAEQRAHLLRQLEQLRPALQPAALRQAADAVRQTLATEPDDWTLHENLGRLLQESGDVPGALAAWTRVAQLAPHYGEAHRQLGRLFTQLGREAEAVQALQQALRVDPRDLMAIDGLAQTLSRQGKHLEAVREYERALQLNPDHGLTHLGLGLSLRALGRIAEADDHLRQALVNRLHTPRALNELGRICYGRGWLSEALTNFTDALRLDPTDVASHMNLGQTLVALGRFAEAQSHYAEVVRLDPNLAEARFRLGFALGRQGRDAEALAEFGEALRLNPDLVEARLNLGIALANQQRLEEALTHFQEALRVSPTNATARQWMERIQAKRSDTGALK